MIRRAAMIIGFIVWPLLGAWVGHFAGPELARANAVVAHPNHNHDKILETSSREIRQRFATGTTWFGAWCGFIVAVQITTVLRKRELIDYDVDPMTCVTCGRCWIVCPVERKRIKNGGPVS